MKHRNQQNTVNILWRETPLYSLTNSTEKNKKRLDSITITKKCKNERRMAGKSTEDT